MSSSGANSTSLASASTHFQVGAIYAVLFSRQPEENWHWSVCVATSATEAICIHAIQPNTNDLSQWALDIKELDLELSQSACVAVRIGLQDNIWAIINVLSTISMSIPSTDKGVEPVFTCRVWWREAIRKLRQSGLINCRDVDLLERECIAFARQNRPEKGEAQHLLNYTTSGSL